MIRLPAAAPAAAAGSSSSTNKTPSSVSSEDVVVGTSLLPLKCMLGRSNNPTPEELLVQLRSFIKGCKRAADLQECIFNGLWLIRHLPVSRDAVFDLISVIYVDFADEHLTKLEEIQQKQKRGNKTLHDDEVDEDARLTGKELVLNEIHNTFVTYLNSSIEIWSPILSTWSLQLLGQISTQFSSRTVLTRAQSVNEIINVWMGSKGIQSLLDLTSKCLKSIDHTKTDAFVSALLDTSAHHSPHFDWVVAHVGNTYPQTVVNEVLKLGLQHFSSNPPQVTRISSVVGILGHLATTHAKEVEIAFDQTIQSGLSGVHQNSQLYAIPYLLQLCPTSVPLLDVLMDCAIPKVNEENLKTIGRMFPQWVTLHFGGNSIALIALITHLILKSTRGPKALDVLMMGCKKWKGVIGSNLRSLLDNFVIELSSLLYESESPQKDFACITALKDHVDLLLPYLIDEDVQIARAAKHIVKVISYYQGASAGSKAIVYYLKNSKSDSHLRNLISLVGALEVNYPNILGEALLTLTVRSKLKSEEDKDKSKATHLIQWKNVLRLLKCEKTWKPSQFQIKVTISQMTKQNISIFTNFLDEKKITFCMEEAVLITEILSNVEDLTGQVRFGELLTLGRYLVDLLFKTLEQNENRYKKVQAVSNISKMLFEISALPAIQNDALRSLVQTSLNPECKDLFKSIRTSKVSQVTNSSESNLADSDEYKPERYSMYVSLLNENRKRSSNVGLLRVQSTSFHSGKLKKQQIKSLNSVAKVEILENPDWNLNSELFLGVLVNICMADTVNGNGDGNGNNGRNGSDFRNDGGFAKDNGVSIGAIRKVALLLVEIVSPDVMFNGLPWPDEEFSKLQVERDLQIRRAFEDHPYLWDLLELVAFHSPSLCYCSVLLRALMATLMAHWASCQEAKTSRSPSQLEWTIRVISIMKTGQLIPPPLCHIGKILPEVKASEAFMLLKDIWWYMKANVPVPTAFIKDVLQKKYVRNSDFLKVDPAFTEKLRIILLNNVETFGHLYPKLFQVDIDME